MPLRKRSIQNDSRKARTNIHTQNEIRTHDTSIPATKDSMRLYTVLSVSSAVHLLETIVRSCNAFEQIVQIYEIATSQILLYFRSQLYHLLTNHVMHKKIVLHMSC
jgi:hypothetical protein